MVDRWAFINLGLNFIEMRLLLSLEANLGASIHFLLDLCVVLLSNLSDPHFVNCNQLNPVYNKPFHKFSFKTFNFPTSANHKTTLKIVQSCLG